MRVAELTLANFRNYERLSLAFQPGLTVLFGRNAQGKTNVLEATYLLASGSSYRAAAEREVIRWQATPEDRLARAAAVIQPEAIEIEAVIAAIPGLPSKRVLVNGAGKRLVDFAGRLAAVLFGPEQLDLVTGSPSVRRAYLDEALTQIDRPYLRALTTYTRVLAQRNQLLKQFRERDVSLEELIYWDGQLIETGSVILRQRARALIGLAQLCARRHAALAPGGGELTLAYETKLFRDEGGWPRLAESELPSIETEFRRRLAMEAAREQAQGVTVVGPHRDDLLLAIDGQPADKFGSRGQQRTAALALKLGELDLIRDSTGHAPVLLLDDVLSELDESRRLALGEAIREQEQVLLTATDLPDLPAAAAYQVDAGTLTPA